MKAAIAIFVLMCLSVPGSLYPGLSFRFIEGDHIKTLALMVLIAGTIRSYFDIERLVVFQVLGALTYSAMVLTRISVGPKGRFGELYYYDANDLALLVACCCPLLVVFLRRKEVTLRVAASLAFALFVLTLVKTGSRGGFLGFLGAGAFMLLGLTAVAKRVRFAAIALIAILLVAVGTDRYWEMMGTMLHPTEDYNWSGNSEAGRMEVWKRGIDYMLSHPFLGVGARAFGVAEGEISPLAERQERGIGLKWSAAHNSFVQIGAELGIGGLACFAALLAYAFATLHRVVRAVRRAGPMGVRYAALAQCFTASLVAYCVSGFFLSQAYSAYLYSVLGMIVGLNAAASVELSAVPLSEKAGGRHANTGPAPLPGRMPRQFP